jgi:hypothetical protein
MDPGFGWETTSIAALGAGGSCLGRVSLFMRGVFPGTPEFNALGLGNSDFAAWATMKK